MLMYKENNSSLYIPTHPNKKSDKPVVIIVVIIINSYFFGGGVLSEKE